MSFFYKATFEIWFGADYLCDKTFWMCLDLSLMIQPPRLMDTLILSAINIYIGKKNFFFFFQKQRFIFFLWSEAIG